MPALGVKLDNIRPDLTARGMGNNKKDCLFADSNARMDVERDQSIYTMNERFQHSILLLASISLLLPFVHKGRLMQKGNQRISKPIFSAPGLGTAGSREVAPNSPAAQ